MALLASRSGICGLVQRAHRPSHFATAARAFQENDSKKAAGPGVTSVKVTRVSKAAKSAAPAITRPPSAMNLFVKSKFQEIVQANPDVKGLAPRIKLVHAHWQALPEGQKKEYLDKAAQAKEAVALERAKQSAVKKANARPMNSYMRFVNEARPRVVASNPGKSVTEIIALISAEWSRLSAEDKAKYTAAYEAEKKVWEAKQPPPAPKPAPVPKAAKPAAKAAVKPATGKPIASKAAAAKAPPKASSASPRKKSA